MIKKTKQDWSVGKKVKVGFLTLRVDGVQSIKDGLPDIYTLSNPQNGAKYEFTPHNGLIRVN